MGSLKMKENNGNFRFFNKYFTAWLPGALVSAYTRQLSYLLGGFHYNCSICTEGDYFIQTNWNVRQVV